MSVEFDAELYYWGVDLNRDVSKRYILGYIQSRIWTELVVGIMNEKFPDHHFFFGQNVFQIIK